MPFHVPKSFQEQLIAILPKLRIQALTLTRNATAADDLVQDALCNAIAAQESFITGTNFPAWMHRILHNRFISNLRKGRETSDIDDVPQAALATRAPQEDRLVLKELQTAMGQLPPEQREALMMVAIQGMSYDELADITRCAIGTGKSRVFRARRQLEVWLTGENGSIHEVRSKTRSISFGA